MAGIRKSTSQPRVTAPRKKRSARATHALLVIDHARLHEEAWAKVQAARQRMDKAARSLHRHEDVDVPAYERWLHRTFPTLVSQLRELRDAVFATARKIQAVETHAFHFGGSAKRIWREHRAREADPERFARRAAPEPEADEPHQGRRHDARPDDFERAARPPASIDARAIYRRLVQRLHPDRGGAWTSVREHLWHEVQQAWAAGDADWLARLETDWEAAHDILGPISPLSRLQRAITELDAARRDIELKLHAYRHEPAWQFTRTENDRPLLHRRVERRLIHDLRALQDQLAHLNGTIAAWDEDWTRADTRVRRDRRTTRRQRT